ncbi:helix-turn-helix transcriptional regulator [Polaribacter cellanae]|uniref:Helix-turn-helix transcriptional regulator n=1 Tax=Polaribacter cellanae TaxID=2818493 RepID=A0A975H8B3_9FLAO|nr:AraC family transcriptional regulator [Polaribacter cellanae]QTE23923.1 helix-turn-helix transcriptional regulator [Polaribacter cellanae]
MKQLYFYNKCGIKEQKSEITFGDSKGLLTEIYFGNFHIKDIILNVDTKTAINYELDKEIVVMEFSLKGSCKCESSNSKKRIKHTLNTHNISYLNKQKRTIHCNATSKECHFFQLCMSPKSFLKFLDDDILVFQNFKKQILSKKNSSIVSESQNISSEMHLIIEQILNNSHQGILKRISLESKILDLLVLQLSQFSSEEKTKKNSLNKDNLEKIVLAKSYIEKHITKTISLVELAKHVGTNEFTLKKGFKEVFNTTVFGLWNELKMEKAKQFLLNTENAIGDIAFKLGYKNQRHFSTAFKKHFGITARQMRNG